MHDLPKLFTVEFVAEQFNVHPETIRRAIRSRRMGCYRLGGCIRVSTEQLAEYLGSILCSSREQNLPAAFVATHDQTSAVAEFRRGRRMRRALDPHHPAQC